ncbi:PQQ-like beta-propeller repeat protein [Maribacter arenosus]|uniref:PQQ-like beta-propeller repeat protein n=1 Tax=Maribacter arenosus TaxID=1854708 RepID=A0ABR7VC50_9FLAO|nr:PQQ-like beta-propeller repeat protein [Maribacter arenosus]MBD0849737.1 PQQ-like beta-propeller repeat protein [Maribacter arenosus]
MKKLLILLINLLVISGYSQAFKKMFGYYSPVKADKEVILNITADGYQELWQFPDTKIIDTARIEYNIFGATRGDGLTRATEKVEPPAIANMQVLSNKNLLIICPKSYRRNNMPFSLNIFKKCNHFIPSNIDVFLLKHENGDLIWKTNLHISGVFETFENDKYIFILSVDYNEFANISDQKISVLNKHTGELVWQKGDKNTIYVQFSNNKEMIFITEKDTLSVGTTFVYTLKNNSVSLLETIPGINTSFEPIITDGDILYMKDHFLISKNIKNQKTNWQQKTDSTLLNYIIYRDTSSIYLPYQNKITALNLNSEKKMWSIQNNNQNIVGLAGNKDQLLLFELIVEPIELDKETKKLTRKKISAMKFQRRYNKSVLSSIDTPTVKNFFRITSVDIQGIKKWVFTDDGEVMSNIETKADQLLFTTKKNLYAIDNTTGKLIQKAELSDGSELSANNIYVLDNKIIVRNEKLVYCFNAENFRLLYQHEFELIWPTLTTTEITKDKIGGDWVMNYVIMPEGVDRQTQLLNQSSENFSRSLQATNKAISASNNNLLTASQHQKIAIDKLAGDMAFLAGARQMAEAGMLRQLADTYKAQLMCHPYLLHETSNITMLDNDKVTVRLVNKTIEEQRFVALEMLEMNTGTLKTQILSPFQFRDYYYTWYRNPVQLWSYLGYVPVLNLKDHVLRTTIDWESGIIYHYGPGLDVDNYKYYEEEYGFIRGKVISVPFNFKTEKRYL